MKKSLFLIIAEKRQITETAVFGGYGRNMSIVKAGKKIGQKIGQGAVKRSWPFYSRMFISIQGYTKIIFRPLSYTQET